jgi:hypothetical protein
MADSAESAVWIDANGRTRQTIVQSLTGATPIVNAMGPCQLGVLQRSWEGVLNITGNVPVGGAYQAVADAFELLFQTASGSILRLTVPAPDIAVFLADGVTVDPANANIVNLVNACLGLLSDGAGNSATVYLGGRYIRASRTDLDTP